MLTYEKTITFDTFVRWLGYGLLVVGVFLFLYYLSGVLLPFAVGWLLAYLLHPAVKFVQFKMRVRNRVLSIIITLIVVLIVVVGVLWLIIPPMIGQFEKLGQLASNYIQQKANVGSVPEAIRLWTDKNRENIVLHNGRPLLNGHVPVQSVVCYISVFMIYFYEVTV